MEGKTFESLMREDRENDLDDVDFGGFQFEEGMDYKKYLERQKEEAMARAQEEGAPKDEPKTKTPKSKEDSRKPKRRKDEPKDTPQTEYRATVITVMMTQQQVDALRIIAGAKRKTLSTLVNDAMNAYYGAEIEEIIESGIIDLIRRKGGKNG